MVDVPNQEWVAEQLARVTCVEWDRFVTGDWGDGTTYLCVYGWIDRSDDYKDFCHLLVFPANEWLMFTTSSEEHTRTINKQLFGEDPGGHNDCIRVENEFEVSNMVEL